MKTLSQADIILARLVRTPNEWVPMPELARLANAFAVHSRIAELNARRGIVIENRIKGGGRCGQPRMSYYRITSPIQQIMF
jgi:hypothetical protein